MSIFTLSRRIRPRVQMTDATYAHLAHEAEDQDRGQLNAFDGTSGHVMGTIDGGAERR